MTATRSRKKTVLWTVLLCVVAALLAALVWAANALVTFAIGRAPIDRNVAPESIVSDENSRTISDNWRLLGEQTRAWLDGAQREPAEIRSEDGLTLRGEAVLTGDAHLWVLAVHGYRGNHTQMLGIASGYGLRGWNVLLPDLRGCGDSEGDYIGMGWPDRRDMLGWIGWILQRDPEAQIVLHGISMGGATVMMTAGESLPPQVKAIVEDCGYTSVWDIFRDELDALFHLPAFPLLPAASVCSRLRAGYGFTEASSLRQLEKAQVPVLFIHGSEDNFVHTDMVYRVYDACPTPKQLLVVEGAGHGSSRGLDPELYDGTVFGFLEPWIEE